MPKRIGRSIKALLYRLNSVLLQYKFQQRLLQIIVVMHHMMFAFIPRFCTSNAQLMPVFNFKLSNFIEQEL
jgi:hypothetical protein